MSLNLRAEANKHQGFWAEMRQTLGLCHRSDIVPEHTIDTIESELRGILDSRILIYPPTLFEYGIFPGTSFEDKKDLLHVSQPRPIFNVNEQKFIESMQEKADKSRKHNWRWRVSQEFKEKQEEKWYPFFVTLTVDPFSWDSEKLWKEGREFRKYIRRLVNVVCKEVGHPPAHKQEFKYEDVPGPRNFNCRRPRKAILKHDYRPESDYVTYAGVIEHGKSREHHHGHFIIWMREIPDRWKQDPNRFIKDPSRKELNECVPMRRYWKFSLPGLSKANYFRSIGDVWLTECKFCLPLKDGEPMKIGNTNAAGAYITKYLQKDHKEWQHRMKCTRNLGMKKLKQLINKLPEKVAEALTWRSETSSLNHFLTTIHSVPLGLIRSVAKQSHYYNQFLRNQWDFRKLVENKQGIYSKMLWSAKHGARPDRMGSSDFYDWVLGFLPVQKGYCEKRLVEAHEEIKKYFPKLHYVKQHTSPGANNIGLT